MPFIAYIAPFIPFIAMLPPSIAAMWVASRWLKSRSGGSEVRTELAALHDEVAALRQAASPKLRRSELAACTALVLLAGCRVAPALLAEPGDPTRHALSLQSHGPGPVPRWPGLRAGSGGDGAVHPPGRVDRSRGGTPFRRAAPAGCAGGSDAGATGPNEASR